MLMLAALVIVQQPPSGVPATYHKLNDPFIEKLMAMLYRIQCTEVYDHSLLPSK